MDGPCQLNSYQWAHFSPQLPSHRARLWSPSLVCSPGNPLSQTVLQVPPTVDQGLGKAKATVLAEAGKKKSQIQGQPELQSKFKANLDN